LEKEDFENYIKELRFGVSLLDKNRNGRKVYRLSLYWKKREFPENFIGGSVNAVSKNLGISELDACNLYLTILNDFTREYEEKLGIVRDATKRIERKKSRLISRTCEGKRKRFLEHIKGNDFSEHMANCLECQNWYFKQKKEVIKENDVT
jgi:hypothetical protein